MRRGSPTMLLLVCLLAQVAAGCTKVRSYMAASGTTTSFFVETTISKGIFGSGTYPVEFNVDNAKLDEHRPLAVAELGFIRLRNINEDLSQMDGFVWYFPADQKVIIATGYRSSKAGDKSISPFIVGEFPAKKAER